MWKNGKIHFKNKSYSYEAKVYEVGSVFGINEGRVSKLRITDSKEEIYNYDRGLDFDKAPQGLVDKILENFQ